MGDETHIHVEPALGETERSVLEAIVAASFKLARPAGRGHLQWNADQVMTDDMAAEFVRSEDGKLCVDMDYVQGRACKTWVFQIEPNHFVINDRAYELDRGSITPMLEWAKKILSGQEKAGDDLIASTSYMYQGADLTSQLKRYGFKRELDEADWPFRQRTFADAFMLEPEQALNILMGANVVEWDEFDALLALTLYNNDSEPDHETLVKFASDFADDPIKMRADRKQTVDAV